MNFPGIPFDKIMNGQPFHLTVLSSSGMKEHFKGIPLDERHVASYDKTENRVIIYEGKDKKSPGKALIVYTLTEDLFELMADQFPESLRPNFLAALGSARASFHRHTRSVKGQIRHHIIPVELFSDSRLLAEGINYGFIEVNSANNIMMLPTSVHPGGHDKYNKKVKEWCRVVEQSIENDDAWAEDTVDAGINKLIETCTEYLKFCVKANISLNTARHFNDGTADTFF